jgi:hypothetical protein
LKTGERLRRLFVLRVAYFQFILIRRSIAMQ